VLKIDKLSAGYDQAEVLRDVSIRVGAGEVVTLCGRNGAGKTTLLRCVMGLHRQQQGTIEFRGHVLAGMAPHKRALLGLGWVPDDRGVYATLSVEENLALPQQVDGQAWTLDQVYDKFPMLYARRRAPGSKLSGGEQRILALARALRTGARLLLCDEPTEGLAPLVISQISETFQYLKAAGTTILLVEQNLRFATTVADRHYLLAEGRVVDALDNSEVQARVHELLAHLGI
jgi:branched-chain amino acid transport system ATP-binding protein